MAMPETRVAYWPTDPQELLSGGLLAKDLAADLKPLRQSLKLTNTDRGFASPADNECPLCEPASERELSAPAL